MTEMPKLKPEHLRRTAFVYVRQSSSAQVLKGTMSEAELYILRARLEGGIRNKAARGELRRGLLLGLV